MPLNIEKKYSALVPVPPGWVAIFEDEESSTRWYQRIMFGALEEDYLDGVLQVSGPVTYSLHDKGDNEPDDFAFIQPDQGLLQYKGILYIGLASWQSTSVGLPFPAPVES